MKKIFMAGAASLFLLASCGGSGVCECADAIEGMMKDYQEAMGDEAEMAKLEKKYAKINEKCEGIRNEMGQEEFNKAIEECMK
jgi:molybdopterin-biosynthesis enzyme MoeA-like protein